MAKILLSKNSKLLILASIVSTIAVFVAITKHIDNKSLTKANDKLIIENQKLNDEIKKYNNNLQALNSKNKKLSKRFINETNKIINLKTSVKSLGEDIKEEKEKLWTKTKVQQNLINENKELENKISKVEALTTSEIHSFLMRKKTNGNFVKTTNIKKIDALKTVFQISKNDFAPSGKRNITVQLFNPKDQKIISDDVFDIYYENKNTQVISLIKLDRETIKQGLYSVRTFIDNNLVKSSDIRIE